VSHVIGGGQADFDLPYKHLLPSDRCLLYAFVNQLGHLEELYEAFGQIFAGRRPDGELIVLDVGCGPFTGGLALAAAVPDMSFSYIGLDRSNAMRELGKKLASAAEAMGVLNCGDLRWVQDFNDLSWTVARSWRPVLVIVSYLLASTTLDSPALVQSIEEFCNRLGRGPVTVLYTNTTSLTANHKFNEFRMALETIGFCVKANDEGSIPIRRRNRRADRKLRYAVFQRQARYILDL
jgi:SAM-dependent methyltransferase